MVARRSTTNWTTRELRFCLQGIRAPMGPLLGSVVQHRVNRPHALGYRKKNTLSLGTHQNHRDGYFRNSLGRNDAKSACRRKSRTSIQSCARVIPGWDFHFRFDQGKWAEILATTLKAMLDGALQQVLALMVWLWWGVLCTFASRPKWVISAQIFLPSVTFI